MIVFKSFSGPAASTSAVQFLRGTAIASGSAGVTTAEDATFTDATTDAFVDVVAGDVMHISGAGAYTVVSVTDVNNVELDGLVEASDTAVSWKAMRDAIDPAAVMYIGPNPYSSNKWDLVYDALIFTV